MACCIKGCNSRRDKNASCKKSFFTAYTNDMFISWSNVLCNKNIKLTKKNTICELHFKAEDIIREDAFLQDDGAVIYIERKNIDVMSSEVSTCEISETPHSMVEKEINKFSAQHLSSGKSINLPTEYWFANINESYMMNELTHILRRVILTPNMKLQVFIGQKEISFHSKRINNIQEVKQILMELQNFFLVKTLMMKTELQIVTDL